ncbi:hypothetical protein SAMN05216241_10697 [Limimonas halophila]|uniref:Protease inhibitor Inh n=1 Tax=Limimonas halophila TaxID=1082479 RepID=A0A1G7S4W1_9PROT|nr:hypothetical protein [Limimonas halophila]SDG17220.1 hypothetical protein SAMN05216241_10697 [Limimonas halophila]
MMGAVRACAAVAALAGLAPGPVAAGGDYTLRLAGNEPAAFDVRCTLETGATAHDIAFTGRPPLTRHFHARGLFCEIRQTAAGGRLDIELRGRDGNVSRLSTGGKDSVITVSVR